MKKHLFLIFSFVCPLFFYGQTVLYKVIQNNVETLYDLMIYADKSSEWRMMINAKREKVVHPEPFLFYKKDDVFYLKEKTLKRQILLKDNPIHHWQLTNEKKEILGVECLSATTTFRGRNYKAFYAPSITLNHGPWKFFGLKGLILEIKSDDGLYSFEAVSMNENIPELEKEKWNNFLNSPAMLFIDWNQFAKKYIDDTSEFINEKKCNCPNDGKSRLRITKIELVYPELHENGIPF